MLLSPPGFKELSAFTSPLTFSPPKHPARVTGLGLYLCQEIMRKYGGALTLEDSGGIYSLPAG